jgi:hydroxymethylglutaryl-CoA synthase
MLVDEDPSVVALSTDQGIGSMDETDFLKPNQQFPSVDGKRSVQVYLARMREALEDYESVAGRVAVDDFRFAPFHTPFPGMVRKAAVLAYRHVTRGTGIEDALEPEIGRQPRETDYEDREAFETAMRDYVDALAETDRYRAWYDRTVDPTLDVSREVGNWYTGSVHLARTSALLAAHEAGEDLTGETLLVGSYGSGAQAEIHAETVREGWREQVGALDLFDRLDDRYDLSFEEYERVHDAHNHDVEAEVDPFTQPEDEFVHAGWGRMNERKYEYVE